MGKPKIRYALDGYRVGITEDQLKGAPKLIIAPIGIGQTEAIRKYQLLPTPLWY